MVTYGRMFVFEDAEHEHGNLIEYFIIYALPIKMNDGKQHIREVSIQCHGHRHYYLVRRFISTLE